jgi:1-acyl-sn-glycerol-3-phosphate acyltransferase
MGPIAPGEMTMWLQRNVPFHHDLNYDALKSFVVPFLTEQLVSAQVTGLEHIPADGPVLLVSSHRTLTDPVLLTAYVPRRIHYVAAGFFGLIPLVAPMLKGTSNVLLPVAGGSRSAALMRDVGGLLRQNRLVTVFPEGVDNFVNGTAPDTISPFHTTFARLVIELAIPRLPVVPVAIRGGEEVSFVRFDSTVMRLVDPGNQAWIDGTVRGNIHRGEARLAIGRPMTFDDAYGLEGEAKEAAVHRIVAEVEGAVRALAAGMAPAAAR